MSLIVDEDPVDHSASGAQTNGEGDISPKQTGRYRYTLVSFGTLIAICGVWTLLTEARIVSASQLPTPQVMARTLWAFFRHGYQGTPWYLQVGLSLYRVTVGFAIGAVTGVATGLLMGVSKTVAAIFRPVVAFMRPVPMIAFVPIVILYFGIGEVSQISLIFVSVYVYTALNTSLGVAAVPLVTLLAGRNIGYTGWRFYWKIVVPASMPAIMAGLRLAAAVAWLLVVAAEMVAAQAGLGYMILDAATFFRIPYVYLGVILIGIIGLVMDTGLARLQRRITHWEGR